MQTEHANQHVEPLKITARSGKLSICLQLANAQTRRRPARAFLSVPRRESCLTRRAMRAALREAEFRDWLNDLADYTANAMQPPPVH